MARFKVRARTVDLLGRQQIASISTAISELFKNAHDAYASAAEVDYFRDDGLFVLRDDGLGMTRSDFEQRWLTLGTDSKVGKKSGLERPPVDSTKAKRPILGEKGIGRLAIALIGKQVLILSRARRDGRSGKTVTAAYLHWDLFELPGVDLDELEIPVRDFPADTLPSREDVSNMVEEAIESTEALAERVGRDTVDGIIVEMKEFDVDPSAIDEYLDGPSLLKEGSGTHFYIKPADQIIEEDIDLREQDDKATRFERNLIGFSDTMTPTAQEPAIITSFRDHVDEGEAIERIGQKAFFTPDEFENADHHITGRFDRFGQFEGTVAVYQTSPEPYILNWKNTDGGPTLCGPFDFSIAVIQGAASDSLLEPSNFAKMKRKLNRHGGVYIYKDGIRIQPYGDSSYDFLDIERRRTLSASYYYYSFRRMMGAVSLESQHNHRLREKAGREGFREDKAYRQFRSILINFFIQSAADFFRDEGKYAEEWTEIRQELNRNEEIRRTRAKHVRGKKQQFSIQLDRFFTAIEEAQPIEAIQAVKSELIGKIEKISESSRTPTEKAASYVNLEREIEKKVADVRSPYVIAKPKGIGLSKDISRQWANYQRRLSELDNEVVSVVARDLQDELRKARSDKDIPFDEAAWLDKNTRLAATSRLQTLKELRTEVDGISSDLMERVQQEARESLVQMNMVVDQVLAELERDKSSGIREDDFRSKQDEYKKILDSAYDTQHAKLNRLRDQLIDTSGILQNDGYTISELTEAMEEEAVILRERQNADLELAQMGLALNTINHEFERTVGALRSSFRRLKAWADENEELLDLYNVMRANFDHLDGYLTLFTPLDRRLQRTATDISGKDITSFLENTFAPRFERHAISLTATPSFNKHIIHGYTSRFYPVFLNLIDNSIFWLKDQNVERREIVLDVVGDSLIVSDNGPGVKQRDEDAIFDLNFTRKPGGRGMGLHISREVLREAGYQLRLERATSGAGATFIIEPNRQQQLRNEDGDE